MGRERRLGAWRVTFMAESHPHPPLPLQGGGQGGGRACPVLLVVPLQSACAPYRNEYGREIPQHLIVREPDDPHLVRFQPLAPSRVVFSLVGIAVGVAIDLDGESSPCTVEVGYETAEQHVLTADVHAQLVIANLVPEPGLGRGEGMAQVS